MAEAKKNVAITAALCVVTLVCVTVSGVSSQATTAPISYNILEKMSPKTLIGRVAIDSGLVDKYPQEIVKTFRYSFLSQPKEEDNRYFAIEEDTGIVHTTKEIDRDVICPQEESCQLTLSIAIKPAEYFQIITVLVEILDKNDHSPEFPTPRVIRSISESMHLGSVISIPAADDPDSPENGIKLYQLSPQTDTFDLHVRRSIDGSTELQLVLKKLLDREVLDYYQIWITAYDGGSPPKSGSVMVSIIVNDTNDNLPEFLNSTYEVRVPESTPLRTPILQVQAFDADIGPNGKIKYGFTPRTQQNYGEIFGIREAEGVIFLRGALDYEQDTIYHLVLTATDSGPGSRPAYSTAIIMVSDVNDNRPQITLNTLTSNGIPQISESSPNGTFVSHVSVIDLDSGANSEVMCSVKDGHDFKLQSLTHPSQYKVVTNHKLDRETKDQYSLTLQCTDNGTPALATTYEMTIQVTDANDHSPVFLETTLSTSIEENNEPEAFLLRVEATDDDIDQNAFIRYIIDPNSTEYAYLFQLSPDTGVLRTNANLDHEQVDQIQLSIIARDQGIPSRSAVAMVTVNILDVNDEIPVFVQKTYSLGVYENQPEPTLVGSVRAVDADSPPYNYVEYSLEADDPVTLARFDVHPKNGQIFTKVALDREERSVYGLRVVAGNNGFPMSSTAAVIIHVADENDNSPVIDFPNATHSTIEVSSRIPRGYVVTRVRASDADIGQGSKLRFTITKGNQDGIFTIDPSTGAITSNVVLADVEYRVYNFTVTATDSGSTPRSGSAKLFIVINKAVAYVPGHGNAGNSGSAAGSAQTEAPNEESSSTNSIILIGVATGSVLVIAVLIIAIVVLKLLDRRHREGHVYNCRTEAQKMLNTYQEIDRHSNSDKNSCTASNNSQNSDVVMEKGGMRHGKFRGPEGSAQRGEGEGGNKYWVETGDERHRGSWPAGVCAETLQHQHNPMPSNQEIELHPGPSGRGQRSGSHDQDARGSRQQQQAVPQIAGSPCQAVPWPVLSDKEIEVHRLLQYLRQQDADRDSSCSDSGCGPSEEGEGQSHPHHTHSHFKPNNSFTGFMVYSSESSDTDSQGSQERINRKKVPLPANQRAANEVIMAPVHYANPGPRFMNPYANEPIFTTNQKNNNLKSDGNVNQSNCGCRVTGKPRHICIPMDIIPEGSNTQRYHKPSMLSTSDSGCHSNSDNSHHDSQSENGSQSTVSAASEADDHVVAAAAAVADESVLDDSRDIPDDGSTTTEGSYVLHQSEMSLNLTDAELPETEA